MTAKRQLPSLYQTECSYIWDVLLVSFYFTVEHSAFFFVALVMNCWLCSKQGLMRWSGSGPRRRRMFLLIAESLKWPHEKWGWAICWDHYGLHDLQKAQHVLKNISVAVYQARSAILMFSWNVLHPIRIIIKLANKRNWLKGAAGCEIESREKYSRCITLTHPTIWLTIWLHEEVCCWDMLLRWRALSWEDKSYIWSETEFH